ncbi:hypothetical protein [Mycobacterium sp. KBS0706]|nr:hypothetical protein [Mycobacterium sp. KBS0706]
MPELLPEPLMIGLALMGACLGVWAIKLLFVSIYTAPYDPTEERG